jgi:hypothetical protein
MTVAVGDDIGAALLDEVGCGVIAVFVFVNVKLPDDLFVGNAKLRCCGLDAFDVCVVVADVFVVEKDNADLRELLSASGAVLSSGVAVVPQAARANTIARASISARNFFICFPPCSHVCII